MPGALAVPQEWGLLVGFRVSGGGLSVGGAFGEFTSGDPMSDSGAQCVGLQKKV